MRRTLFAMALAQFLLPEIGLAETKPEVDLSALEAAVAASDRDQVSNLLSENTAKVSDELALKIRLLLMERLATLSAKDRAERQEAAAGLLALYPEEKFVLSLAAGTGIDVYSKMVSSEEGEVGSSESIKPEEPVVLSWRFTNFLKDGNGKKLVEELLTASYIDQIPAHQREEAEAVVLSYVRPLPASRADANRDGYKILAALKPENGAYQEKLARYENAISQQRASILRRMRTRVDEFNGITFYRHPNEPKYTDTRSYLAVYAGKKEKRVWLRMRLNYTSDDWLFVSRAIFNIDGRIVPLQGGSWKRDNDSEIWEWVDMSIDDSLRQTLLDIAESEKTIVRFEGRQYYKNVTIREADKQTIRDMFIVEEVLNEQASG